MAKITLMSTSELMSKSQHHLQYYNHNKRSRRRDSSTNVMAKASESPQGLSFYQDNDIDQILDCVRKDGCRYYKIRWRDTWVREESLRPFEKKLDEFWERIEHSRKVEEQTDMKNLIRNDELNSEKMTHRYGTETPIDRPPSPVYRNGTEYSPPPSELGEERSPYTSTIKLPPNLASPPSAFEQSPTPSYEHENFTGDDNALPALSNGRRKGKPKKLIRDDEEEENNHEKPDEKSDEKRESSLDETESNPSVLTVEIPENTANQRRSSTNENTEKKNSGCIEEYPVMIIKEQNEETVTRTPKTKIHKPDALQFTEEPPLKRPRVPTPEYERKAPIYVPSTVANMIPKNDKYTSPVPSPEDTIQNTSMPSMYQSFANPSRLHFSSRQSVFKSFRDHRENIDNVPVIYHAHDIPGRKQSVDSHYIHPEPRKYFDRISSIPESQLLLKVSRPMHHPSLTSFYQQRQQKQQHEISMYQNAPVTGPANVKTRTIIKDSAKTKTPTKYLITADGEQRPQCPECFQTFKKRAALERHMMIHRGIKPFQCHFCNQRFRQKHHLQGHIMLHTGERPHSCTLCNKRFRMRHHLLEHERISHKVFR